MDKNDLIGFDQLSLNKPILKAIKEVGYKTPSPIQEQIIPLVLEGRDVIGQAQTGTGKTAAFALPLLSMVDVKRKSPQILVLTPTRELALQVAKAFQTYAKHLDGFRIAPIYGGQGYETQLKQLRQGVHVVVGTPGRVIDHMRRGTLNLSQISCLVLDEADEMLRMGFVEDVESVLENMPTERQIALFSATMPKEIRRIASKYLVDPKHVAIKSKVNTADGIEQHFWLVSGTNKLDALTRLIEVESFEAMLCFVKTRKACVDLVDSLSSRGFRAMALHGEVAQAQREQIVKQLRTAKIDVVVATDVAARGLDVERISHVINYDIPQDTEAYIHRIGRTGRAGRLGKAILFVAPREKRMLRNIERATKQKISPMELPSNEQVLKKRGEVLKSKILKALKKDKQKAFFTSIINEVQEEAGVDTMQVAVVLARLLGSKSKIPEIKTTDSLSDAGLERKGSRARGQKRDFGQKRRGRKPKANRRDFDRSSSPRRGKKSNRARAGK